MIIYETDSRKVKPGQTFIAIEGHTVDGHDYIDAAIKNGATKIIGTKDIKCNVPYEKVTSSEKYLEDHLVFEYSKELDDIDFIGVTGTSCKTIVMEVSSHALELNRILGVKFKVAGFTNLTQDHLDFHKTIDNYFEAKLKLLNYLDNNATFITNSEDEYGSKIVNKYSKTLTYGENNANYIIKTFDITPSKTKIKFIYNNNEYEVTTNLTSEFNVYNYMLSLALINNYGISIEEIINVTKNIKAPKGRCETYGNI